MHERPDIFVQEGIEIRNSFVIRGQLLDLYDAGVRLKLCDGEHSASSDAQSTVDVSACPKWYSELYYGCVSVDVGLRPTFHAIIAVLSSHCS